MPLRGERARGLAPSVRAGKASLAEPASRAVQFPCSSSLAPAAAFPDDASIEPENHIPFSHSGQGYWKTTACFNGGDIRYTVPNGLDEG